MFHFISASKLAAVNGEWKDSDGNYTIANYPFTKIWADMEKLLETKKVKAIGISNFSIKKFV
jgi:diketogulonate reductase-like aldo/keto reductase